MDIVMKKYFSDNEKKISEINILVISEWYNGFRWHVPQFPPELNNGDFDVMNIPFLEWPKDFFSIIYHIKNIIKHIEKYDVLILRGNTISTLSFVILKYLKIVKKFVVVAEFNTSEKNSSIRSNIKYYIYGKIFNKCELILPFTDIHLKYYEDKLKLSSRKMVTIPEAVNYLGINEYPALINCDGDYILSVGRTGRDYMTFCEAIKDRNDKIIVVSNKKNVDGLEFPANVSILFDIPLDDLLDLVSRAKYIVLPLKDSIHPVGLRMLFYAMERGKACIVTNTKTISEYFSENSPLIVVPPGDSESLRNAMDFLDSNFDEIRNLGIQSRKLVEKKFTSRNYIVNTYMAIHERYSN